MNKTSLKKSPIITSILAAFLLQVQTLYGLPDIVFVTQAPHPQDFATINSTFANHLTGLDAVPRGGDLYIRYSDGTLRNLTKAAGYGVDGFQNQNGIAVRDPAVHWNAEKVLFSMLIGAPTERYQINTYRWQLYEISGLSKGSTPVISKVPNQPSEYNNVMPTYGTDDRIIFASDRPRDNLEHTYPQRDEYESTATNTGLWSLDPLTGDLLHLDHSPSGDFHPKIDSFGRVIFTRWDHLQRDQQNRCSQEYFEAFNYSSEAEGAAALDSDQELYPEPRAECERVDETNLDRHSFNHFLPWQINEDGTEIETINHIGRHELVSYLGKSFNDDSNIEEFYSQYSRVNQNSVESFFQIREHPNIAGLYFGINAPEFGTHAAGQIISMQADPSIAADQIEVNYITHPDTAATDDTPAAEHIGLSRDPLILSDNTLIAVNTSSTLQDSNIGSSAEPASRYAFRLKTFTKVGDYYKPSANLTNGIKENISFWSPDELVSYNQVTMWELQPVELLARAKPSRRESSLPDIEKSVFTEAGVAPEDFQDFLRENNLALIVSRNVTTRDQLDRQQPFNLRVSDAETETIKNSGKVYEVAHLQIFEGDLIRAYGGSEDPSAGRRVLAQPLHSVAKNPENPSGPTGSVKIAADGSMAALVPAQKAITYQLTDPEHKGVVRERVWLTFQPGEIRVCASCHGANSKDQIGQAPPTNPPQALAELLAFWKDQPLEKPKAKIDLSLVKAKKKKIKGIGFKFKVEAENEIAKNKTFKLQIKIGNYNCGDLHIFETSEQGLYEVQTKKIDPIINSSLSNPAINKEVSVNLLYFGNVIASDTLSIRLRNKNAKVKRICKSIEKAFD